MMYMIVLIHVTIALLSIAYTTFLFVFPAKSKFSIAYALIASTLVSGTYLVLSTHTNLEHACMAGLIYLGAVSFAVASAHHRLVTVKKRIDR